MGIVISLIFVPLLSEIINAVKEKKNVTEKTEVLVDLAALVFNLSDTIGAIISPIVGGVLNDHFGYRKTCDIIAFCALCYAVIYFFLITLPYYLNKRK